MYKQVSSMTMTTLRVKACQMVKFQQKKSGVTWMSRCKGDWENCMWLFVEIYIPVERWENSTWLVDFLQSTIMSVVFVFTDLCLNGQLVTLSSKGGINECQVYEQEGGWVVLFAHNIHMFLTSNPRLFLALTLEKEVSMEINVRLSLSECNVIKF